MTPSDPTYVPVDAFLKLVLEKLQGIKTNFKGLEAYVKKKSMRVISNQKLLASKLNVMAEAQVKKADEKNVEIMPRDKIQSVFLDFKTEGSEEDEMEEDDEDGE